uniref:Putative ankyrin-repeat protein n=1 Tax=Trypanosoma vivax (strain Y486) TaxID=1055687 RepID=G0U3T0_TRYVY|nr:putative ankyrin-repeat protein, fragment [Trypanosoma vivax Y486]
MRSQKEKPTPANAPILCQIRTPCMTCSRLVGTLQTSLNSTLSDVRRILAALASGNPDSSLIAGLREAPVNVTPEEVQRMLSYPLHPFDLGADFSFLIPGSGKFLRQSCESELRLVDVFQCLPHVRDAHYLAAWGMEPPAPLVKVPVKSNDVLPLRCMSAVLFVSYRKAKKLMKAGRHIPGDDFDDLQEFFGLNGHFVHLCRNMSDCFGRTMLHDCVYHGRREGVAHLLSLPFVSVNDSDVQGRTPLHIAVRSGDEAIVSLLLASKADVLLSDVSGNTALHIALCRRNDRLVHLLCRALRMKGVDVAHLGRHRNKLGLSPLDIFGRYWPTFHQLCEAGDVSSVKSLYKHYLFDRQSVYARDGMLQQTAVHLAAAGGHVKMLKLLFEQFMPTQGKGIQLLNGRLQTPLHVAVEGGHFAAVKLLHKLHPEWLSLQDINGITPLLAALRLKQRQKAEAIAVYFLRSSPRGAIAPDQHDNTGTTALHLLCERGLVSAANCLIVDHGADVNVETTVVMGGDNYLQKTKTVLGLQKYLERRLSLARVVESKPGVTPLLSVLRGRRSSLCMIEMLLSHGAAKRVDEVVELLSFLILGEHYDLADRVVESGVADSIQNNELLCRLCQLKHSVGIRWCVERRLYRPSSPAGGSPLIVSASVGDANAVQFLLGHGAEVNTVDEQDRTPLLVAIVGGHDAVVENIVRSGAHLVSPDGKWSALRTAAELGAEPIVRALLGLSSLPPSEVQRSLVHALQNIRGKEQARRLQVCLHLARALDFNLSDGMHPTDLLHLAASRFLFEVVEILIEKLLALPHSVMHDILRDPPDPPSHAFVVIEPSTVPIRHHKAGIPPQRSLCPPPKPFRRRRVGRREQNLLHHRRQMRDVFSYCAGAGQSVLVKSLLFDVGLRPWKGADHRGWNAADYAVAGRKHDIVRMFLVVGVLPLRSHNVLGLNSLGLDGRLVAGCSPMDNVTVPLSSILCKLARAQETFLIRRVLLDVCQCYGVEDLSDAGTWLNEVIQSCVHNSQIKLLRLLITEFRVTLVRHLPVTTNSILVAVANRDVEMVELLVAHGISIEHAGTIPPVRDCISLALHEGRKVTPLWLAARLGDTILMRSLLQRLSALCPEVCVDTEECCGDILKAIVSAAPRRLTSEKDAAVALIVAVLKRAGHPYSSCCLVSKILSTPFKVNPVDHALTRGCSEGALLLIALGLCGEGLTVKGCNHEVFHAVRLCLSRRSSVWSRYTVLHAAVELGYYTIAEKLVRETLTIYGPSATVFSHSCERSDAPALESLIAFYLSKKHRCALHLSGVPAASLLDVRDMAYIIWSKSTVGIEEDFRETIRRSVMSGYMDRVLDLLSDQLPVDFVALLIAQYERSFFFQRRTFAITVLTPMACAVVAGRFSWVKLMASCGVSASSGKSVIAKRRDARLPSWAMLSVSPRSMNLSRASLVDTRGQAHGKLGAATSLMGYTHERCLVSPLLASTAVLMECLKSADHESIEQQKQITKFLLDHGGCSRRGEANLLAIAVSGFRQWDLLEAIVAAAGRLQDDTMGPYFFTTITEAEVPPILRQSVGSARHVLHRVARYAPKEIFLTVMNHSSVVDIERSYDARGKSVVYHALHHPSLFALDILLSSNVSMSGRCCKKTKRTPLMVACRLGRLPLVERVMNKEVLNLTDGRGNSALLLASAMGHLNVVEYLLSNGSDVSVVNLQGMTAPMVAAFAGHDHVAVPLVEHFSTAGDLFTPQTTVLHCAAVGNAWNVVASVAIHTQKADPAVKDASGYTAIELARYFGNAHVLRALLAITAQRGCAALLHDAAESRALTRRCHRRAPVYGWLRGVMQMGVSLTEGLKQRSSTSSAALPGEMAYGITSSFRSRNMSLLSWCVRNNNVVGVCVLGDMGVRDDCGALYEAAKRGNVEIARLLLRMEMSNPNVPNRSGWLPFEIAAMNRHKSCASILLAHSKVDVSRLQTKPRGFSQNVLQCIVSVAPSEFFVEVLEALRRGSGDAWASVADKLLEVLGEPDETGMTLLESVVGMNDAAGLLCITERLQLLIKEAKLDPNAPGLLRITPAHLYSISPAVRALLYDAFSLEEVSSCGGMQVGPVDRLTFADVRLIGINALRRDTFCAGKVAEGFTLEREKTVVSTFLAGLPFKITYKLDKVATRTPFEHVQLLQWLGSSLVLSNYDNCLGRDALDVVELDVVSHPSEEFVEFSARHLRHSVCVSGGYLCVPNLENALGLKIRREAQQMREVVERQCCLLTELMRKLPHTALAKGQVRVDWCGVAAAAAVRRVTENGLPRVRSFLEGKLRDCLLGVHTTDILTVLGVSEHLVKGVNIVFQYTKGPVHGQDTRAGSSELNTDGMDCIILFNEDAMEDVDLALHSTVYRTILANVNMVGVSFARDILVASVLRHVGEQMNGAALDFKLEAENSGLHEMPLHLLKEMLKATVEAVVSLIAIDSAEVHVLHSSSIVSKSLASTMRRISLLFSTKRSPLAKYSHGELLLCFNKQSAPSQSDIYNCLREGAVAFEIDKLKRTLLSLLAAASNQLNMCLPSVPLVMDSPSIMHQGDSEFLLSTLSVLCHEHGSLVLEPLIKGVTVGWDRELGDIVRQHVRQVKLMLEFNGNASCELHDSGNFVYRCPLHCVERGLHGTFSWHLLSSQQIASLLLVQLFAVNPDVGKHVNTSKPMACWTQVHGCCTRLVDAGSTSCSVTIAPRSMLNLPATQCKAGALTFVGEWHSVEVCESTKQVVSFTAPKRAGYYYQHVLMDGQPLFNSPLLVRVRPLAVHLPNTKNLSRFNAVVVGKPFHLTLLLRDKYGNRVEDPAVVHVERGGTDVARVTASWRPRVDTIVVEAVVVEVCPQCELHVSLSTGDGQSFVFKFEVACVEKREYDLVRHLRAGLVQGNEQERLKAREYARLFFRQAIRNAEHDRLECSMQYNGHLLKYVFP